jgi:hypothetical protein
MRFLHRSRPDVDVALLVEPAVEGKGILFRPRAHNQIMRLCITVAQHARVLPIRKARVHWGPDREAGDQPPARDHVDHRELFGDARRRVVECE